MIAVLAGGAVLAAAEDFDREAAQLRARYKASLEQLAGWCKEKGLNEQAAKTLACLCPTDPYKLYVPVIPDRAGSGAPPANAAAEVVEWDTRLKNLRRDQANAVYELARRAMRGGRAALAYDLAVDAIRANPDHEALRRMLGYQKLNGEWRTQYEARKIRAKMVWSPKFGWLLQGHLVRYQQGQRYSNGKWISADEDRRQHQDIRNGWEIETEHYTVRTNHSLEAGVQLGVKLERLYRVWQQLFVRFYATEAQVLAMFEGRQSTPLNMPRHQVVYFRDQDDYNRSLKPALPNVEQTIGAYLQQTRRAYFFAAQQPDDRTLYHEATHQLFHESRPVAPDVAFRANYWIIEGVAMYMESLHEEDGFYVLGGVSDTRMNAAAVRLLRDSFYVPLAEFTGYGMQRLQTDPRIATLYSQAAGQTHFLMHAQGGRYRDTLVAYLYTIYNGRDDAGTLAALTGKPYAELDRQYRAFVTEAVQATAK